MSTKRIYLFATQWVIACIVLAASRGAAHAAAQACGGPSAKAIYTVADLQNIQNNLSATYVLCGDIDASGFDFSPLGSNPFASGVPFTGVFDGQGHTIYGLSINRLTTDIVGLFGYVLGYTGGGVIKNVKLINANINGHDSVGGLVGYSDTGHISNVAITGTVTGNNNVGGLVGQGGNYYGNTTLTNSFSTANVTGASFVGGLSANGINIQNSYSLGKVSGYASVGGLVGDNSSGSVVSSYAAGLVSSTTSAGGLIGTNGGSVINSYWDKNTTSTSAGGTVLPHSKLTSITLPVGFTSDVWKASAGAYPSLYWESTSPPAPLLAAALARQVAFGDYLFGGKGFDMRSILYVEPDSIKSIGYYYYNGEDKSIEFDGGLDCSGLVMWAYNKAFGARNYQTGNPIFWEGANSQYLYNTFQVTAPQLLPGDLLFFGTQAFVHHVAMYVGCPPCGPNGTDDFVEAYDEKQGIKWSSTKDLKSRDFLSFGRVNGPITGIKITAHSPINLIVTDPNGFTITTDTVVLTGEETLQEVTGVLYYSQSSSAGSSSLDATVSAPMLKPGNYRVRVVPKPGAAPTDTYSLDVEASGHAVNLATDVAVRDIPTQGYAISSTGFDIMPFTPLAADLNTDGLVNCADLAIVKASLGKRSGQAGFDVRADINLDGVVDIKDLAFVSQKLQIGTRCQ